MMSGKGSSPRPFSVDRQTYESNWDMIFKNKQKEIPWDHYSDLPSPEHYIEKENENELGR
jgi:hypothetical protein